MSVSDFLSELTAPLNTVWRECCRIHLQCTGLGPAVKRIFPAAGPGGPSAESVRS